MNLPAIAIRPVRHSRRSAQRHAHQRGQALVEFGLSAMFMFVLALALGDFGRMYNDAVAVEAAAREAADFGAFHASYWDTVNRGTTVGEMKLRACTAAEGSHISNYVGPHPANSTCTSPAFSCWLAPEGGPETDCLDTSQATQCSDPATDPGCIVHVRLDYTFNTIFNFPPIPGTIHLIRDSRFRIGELTPPS